MAETSEAPSRPGQIGDSPYSIQGVSILLGLLVAVLTIVGSIRSWFSSNAKEAQEREDRLKSTIEKHQETIEDRLKVVEVTIRDFMPRNEIESKIEHEKGNRTQADLALKERLDSNSRDIVDIKVGVGRLEQQQAGTAATVERVEELVKEQGRDHALRFDKIQDCLNSLSRRP